MIGSSIAAHVVIRCFQVCHKLLAPPNNKGIVALHCRKCGLVAWNAKERARSFLFQTVRSLGVTHYLSDPVVYRRLMKTHRLCLLTNAQPIRIMEKNVVSSYQIGRAHV